ncbi:PAS domain S-box protein [Mucilaginibacter sp. McL0603]|uniref:PAS domain S-box protein n=1 Tax=Mucilaginibacter sp. McL0603 TaxID=3415670 RepID=UPI003CE99FD9
MTIAGPLRIAILYVAIALIWITLSDRILFLFQDIFDPEIYSWINSGKGFFFVIITGFLLYKLIIIDERRLIEIDDQQRRSDDELKRLANIVTRVNNMIIITDENNHITWINKAVEDRTGFHLHEIAGKSPSEFFIGPETGMDVLGQIIQRKKALEIFSMDIGCYTKSGDRFWVHGEFTPLFDDDYEHTGYIAVYNDISWRKQKEDEITRQNDKLKEVAWLSSHEIRRPLANIMGLANVMRVASNMDEKVEIMESINLSAKELDKIVHKINSKINEEINSDLITSSR